MVLEKKDFIELDYIAMTKEGEVFDTTKKELSDNKNAKPMKICIGRGHLIKGLDEKLEGLSIGKHKIELKTEEAFGKKDSKKLKLMPMKLFKNQGINPYVGLQLNIDNALGVVRSVSGGRVIMDFNHPLAGKDVLYDIDIKRIITDEKEKVMAILELLNFKYEKLVVDDKIVLTTKEEVPEHYKKIIEYELKETIGKEIRFEKQ